MFALDRHNHGPLEKGGVARLRIVCTLHNKSRKHTETGSFNSQHWHSGGFLLVIEIRSGHQTEIRDVAKPDEAVAGTRLSVQLRSINEVYVLRVEQQRRYLFVAKSP